MDEIALLRRLDHDAAAESPDAKHAARSALRARIAAQQTTAPAHHDVIPRARARQRWPLLQLVAAVAAVVVVTMVAVVVYPGRGSRPAHAATPPLLTDVRGDGRPAERVLERLAAAAEEQPAPADLRYEYLRSAGWGLHTSVYDEDHVESVIVPRVMEMWRADDGSVRIIEADGEPVEAGPPGPDADRRAMDDLPDGEGEVTDYPPGELWQPPIASLPRDPVALRDKLVRKSDERPDHVQLWVSLEELHVQRVPPDLLAAFYRVLAEDPDMRAYGGITDRAGRRGIAVGFDSDYAGLPTRHMLIVDPETGTPLGLEEILTTDPGKLNVRVPAVISYVVYLAGGPVASMDERAPRIPITDRRGGTYDQAGVDARTNSQAPRSMVWKSVEGKLPSPVLHRGCTGVNSRAATGGLRQTASSQVRASLRSNATRSQPATCRDGLTGTRRTHRDRTGAVTSAPPRRRATGHPDRASALSDGRPRYRRLGS